MSGQVLHGLPGPGLGEPDRFVHLGRHAGLDRSEIGIGQEPRLAEARDAERDRIARSPFLDR